MSEHIDFQQLAAQLLARSYDLVSNWFPAGRKEGREWKVGNLRGDAGDSLSINLATGAWGDFAGDIRGGDLISLYAAREGLTQLEAAKKLSNGASHGPAEPAPGERNQDLPAPPDDVFEAPPPGQNFNGAHKRYGAPTATYVYRDAAGEVLYYVCRYDPEGGKQIIPWRWVSHPGNGKPAGFRARHVPRPRPLYNLHRLAADPSAPVLLVEGEKCVEAASRLVRETIVTTWSGGSAHARYADYSPLAGRRVNIWPDADEPGWEAAAQIARILVALECTVGIVDTHGQPLGWDIADAIQEGWTLDQILKWAREHKRPIVKVPPPARVETPIKSPPERAQDVQPAEAPPPDEDTAAAGFHAQWRQYGLALDGQGRPFCNVDNVVRVINEHPGTWSHVWYDEFLQRIMSNADGKKGEWTDVHTLRLMLWFQRALGMAKLGSDIVHAAITLYAHSKPRNEARDWLNGLTWDGVERLPQLVPVGFGALDNAYHRSVGRCFIMGACQRVLVPGCKLDNMPVFEGEEGIFKSTALEILGGPYYCATHEKVGEKDFYLVLTGKMIVEIVEMHSFTGAAQERIKGVISDPRDRYRAPYGRLAADHPRMSVFAGTTNEDDWNKSTTGARRFWPVACGKIDLAWIRDHREQLFAEGCARLRRGEVWYDVDSTAARAEQVLRQPGDLYEEVLLPHLERRSEISMAHVVSLLGIEDRDRWTPALQARLSALLRRAGFVPYRPRVDGVQIRAWRKRLPAEAGQTPPSDEPMPESPDLQGF